jgi:hypothetical protein
MCQAALTIYNSLSQHTRAKVSSKIFLAPGMWDINWPQPEGMHLVGGNILSWRYGANLRLMVCWFCEAIQVYGILEGYGTMKVNDALGLRDNCSLYYFWFKLRTFGVLWDILSVCTSRQEAVHNTAESISNSEAFDGSILHQNVSILMLSAAFHRH